MAGGRDDIGVEVDGHVAVVEIRRPPNNFFDVALIGGLADAIESLGRRRLPRRRAGQRGPPLLRRRRLRRRPRQPRRGGPHLYEMAIRLFEQPLPIVAAVQGAAIGGGFGLAMAADFRVAAPEARFAANFARLGFHHGFGLSVTLPLVAGHQAALDLLYTGRRIDGDEALRLGRRRPPRAADELRDAALALAGEIAASAPLAVRSIRETMRGHLAGRGPRPRWPGSGPSRTGWRRRRTGARAWRRWPSGARRCSRGSERSRRSRCGRLGSACRGTPRPRAKRVEAEGWTGHGHRRLAVPVRRPLRRLPRWPARRRRRSSWRRR